MDVEYGAILGIAIGGLFVILAVVGVFFFRWHRIIQKRYKIMRNIQVVKEHNT